MDTLQSITLKRVKMKSREYYT